MDGTYLCARHLRQKNERSYKEYATAMWDAIWEDLGEGMDPVDIALRIDEAYNDCMFDLKRRDKLMWLLQRWGGLPANDEPIEEPLQIS